MLAAIEAVEATFPSLIGRLKRKEEETAVIKINGFHPS